MKTTKFSFARSQTPPHLPLQALNSLHCRRSVTVMANGSSKCAFDAREDARVTCDRTPHFLCRKQIVFFQKLRTFSSLSSSALSVLFKLKSSIFPRASISYFSSGLIAEEHAKSCLHHGCCSLLSEPTFNLVRYGNPKHHPNKAHLSSGTKRIFLSKL